MDQESYARYVASDEIDLMGLIVSLWEEKWTIIGVTALVTALSVVFVLLPVHTYQGSMEIKPVSVNEEAHYLVLNGARNALSGDNKPIDRKMLLDVFADELYRRNVFYAHLQASGLVKREQGEGEADYAERVSQVANADITFERPSREEDRVYKPYWTLRVKTKDPALMKDVLLKGFAEAETETRRMLLEKVNSEIALKQNQLAFSLDELRASRQNELASYDEAIANRLAYLEEQAGIARSLGIAKNTIETQTFAAGNSVVASIAEDMPFYLRGYEAIEKEISLITSRESKEPYIGKLLEINREIRTLENDLSVPRAKTALANSPLVDGTFNAASYDIRGMKLESKTRSVLPIILAIFVGGMIAMVVALVRSGFRKRAVEATA